MKAFEKIRYQIKGIKMVAYAGMACFLGLVFVSMSLDKIARAMSDANYLKRKELESSGVKLD